VPFTVDEAISGKLDHARNYLHLDIFLSLIDAVILERDLAEPAMLKVRARGRP
jgi:hypothetical protein